jgi:purine nucleosidase/pyrimidine-specific ribonucleoside hydrolase
MNAPRITIIDTDPGIDDAVAILFALAMPGFDIRAITTLAGNIGLDTTTRNALRLLALAGRTDIPVHPGAAKPLARPARDSAEVHGDDGLGGVPLPEPASAPSDIPAAEAIARILEDEPEGTVDILALGPLTNLMQLVLDRPTVALRVGRIVAMGGAVAERGNVGPRAEFNMAADPEAAHQLFGLGLPVTLVPLDVTRKVRADRDWCDRLAASGRYSAEAAAELIRAYFDHTAHDAATSRPLHDPCVMLFAERPDLFGLRPMPLAVNTGQGTDEGALIEEPGRPPLAVAMSVESDAALALLAEGLMR